MTDKKIVAIGGGENGKPGYPYETYEIDKRIAELTGKSNPKLLFIGTANSDNEKYYEVISQNFRKFGCVSDNLALMKVDYSLDELENKILSADIIYVGGGNTKMMLEVWRERGVDRLLLQAYEKDVVLSGISAGSMWFTYINPDLSIRGLGLINCAHRPHYGKDGRKEEVKEMMRNLDGYVAVVLEDCVALEVVNDKYRIIKSDKSKKGYKTYWHNGEYTEKEIMCAETYGDFNELIHITSALRT